MADIAQLRGMEPVDQFICLMHDAAEAYIGDVVHPFKIMLPMVKECEDRILRVMGDKYGVRLHDLEHVFKDMDRQLCKAEAQMYGMKTSDWTDPDYVYADGLNEKESRLLEAVSKWDHLTVRDHFENMFYELFGEIFVI
jgi:5'-deoxynucleotidase YfbR-like HD superfamily hydrolase